MTARVGDVVDESAARALGRVGYTVRCDRCKVEGGHDAYTRCGWDGWRITALPPTAAEPVAEVAHVPDPATGCRHGNHPISGYPRCVDRTRLYLGREVTGERKDDLVGKIESRDARIAELEAEVAAVRKIQTALRDVVENKRADRWHASYNAALGISDTTVGDMPMKTFLVNGVFDNALYAAAVKLHATAHADAAHGPLKGGE